MEQIINKEAEVDKGVTKVRAPKGYSFIVSRNTKKTTDRPIGGRRQFRRVG